MPVVNVKDVSFSWTSPDLRMDWTGTGDSYEVRYRTNSLDWSGVLTTGDDTGITISGLTQGKVYTFEVVTIGPPARASTGERSLAAYYGFTIPQGLTAPTGCTLVEDGLTQIQISWQGAKTEDQLILITDSKGVTGSIPVSQTGGGTGVVTYTETITDLDPTVNYKIQIAAVKNEEALLGDCYIDKAMQCC